MNHWITSCESLTYCLLYRFKSVGLAYESNHHWIHDHDLPWMERSVLWNKIILENKNPKIAKQAKSKKHPGGLHDDHRRPRLHQHPAAHCHPHRNRQLIGSNSVVATFNHQSIHPTPSNYSRNSPGPGNKNKNEWIELILWGARRLHRRLLAKISPMASSWIGYWFHVNIGAGSVRSKNVPINSGWRRQQQIAKMLCWPI